MGRGGGHSQQKIPEKTKYMYGNYTETKKYYTETRK